MTAWQPISTAPKDEADFLAWDGYQCLILRWDDCIKKWSDWEMRTFHPTHWQALPPPPDDGEPGW